MKLLTRYAFIYLIWTKKRFIHLNKYHKVTLELTLNERNREKKKDVI